MTAAAAHDLGPDLAERWRRLPEPRLISALICGADLDPVTRSGLTPQDFGDLTLGAIYKSMLNGNREPEDVLADLVDDGAEQQTIWPTLDGCLDLEEPAENAGKLAREVRGRALTDRIAKRYEHLALHPEDGDAERELDALRRERDRVRGGSKVFQVLSEGAEFMADRIPEPIVEHMVYRSILHALWAREKTGKTYFMLQMLMALAAGLPFLGCRVKPSRVFYLSEMRLALLRDRMEKIAKDTDLPMPTGDAIRFCAPFTAAGRDYSNHGINLTDPGDLAELRECVREAQADVLVIDTLTSFIPDQDQNKPEVIAPLFGSLRQLGLEADAAVVLVDHSSKGQFADGPSGSVQKQAQSGQLLELKRASQSPPSWELDIRGHLGEIAEPIAFRRPERMDGTPGFGCVRDTVAGARGLTLESLFDLFDRHGTKDDRGRPQFESQRRLKSALQAEGLASGNESADVLAKAIRADFCARPGDPNASTRPVWITDDERNAITLTWANPDFTDPVTRSDPSDPH